MVVNELTIAEHAGRSAYQRHTRNNSDRLGAFIGRMRFQLGIGLIAAVALPACIRYVVEPERWEDNSLIGSAWAFLFGYLMFRKVTGFPGVRASALILPVFVAAYAITVAGFFLLRLDYSRLQLTTSFIFAIVAFYGVFIAVRRLSKMELSLVPLGDTDLLRTIRFVEWRTLNSPSDARVGGGIVVDFSSPLTEEWERFIADHSLNGMPVYNAKHVQESLSGRVQIKHLSENTLGALAPSSIYASGKHYCDFFLAIVALALLWPLMLLAATAVRIESPGPAIFRQTRVGHRGRAFTVFKLRTMFVPTAEDSDQIKQVTTSADRRITKLGRFLRKTRIDELPQIFNILRGEMSWIGPRPETQQLSADYERVLPFYRYRHTVRPGVTGWAQVNQGHVTTVEDTDLKLQYDFFYVKNFSLWLDILVFIRTIRVIVSGNGAK